MKLGKTLVVSAILMAVSTAAFAFQEQQGAAGAAATPAPAAAASKPVVDFSTGDGAKSETVGTEVRIPGLGKLGVLPKMDFGLELLYGAAAEPKAEAVSLGQSSVDDDLRIRGTVKHRF